MRVGTVSRMIERGSIQRTMTARVARLALAIATISLNDSMFGSCRNWGAPPDSEIAVATSVASRALVAAAAAKAANHSRGPGGVAGVAMRWKIVRATIAASMNWATLKTRLSVDWFLSDTSASPVPTRQART